MKDKNTCPKCNETELAIMTGYCTVYSEPILDKDCITGPYREMCFNPQCIDLFTHEKLINANIRYCIHCDTFYDSKNKPIDLASILNDLPISGDGDRNDK